MNNLRYCKQPQRPKPRFRANVSKERRNFILSNNLKWVNGTVIKYFFIGKEENQKNVVRHAIELWEELGIGVSFEEINSPEKSIIRIDFDHNDGSWSYVGRDNLNIRKEEKTMNFGWDLTQQPYGLTTALHEIGHALGFQHEHQNPFSGIEWNIEEVRSQFSAPPNFWNNELINSNILDKLPANMLNGSSWDPNSIMQYQFGPGLINKPSEYQIGIYPSGGISPKDIEGIRLLYPQRAKNQFVEILSCISKPISASVGDQVDFIFCPLNSKEFNIQTVGKLDTVIVLFEKSVNEWKYLGGDDDSGEDRNARVNYILKQGKEYIICVRVIYTTGEQDGALIII